MSRSAREGGALPVRGVCPEDGRLADGPKQGRRATGAEEDATTVGHVVSSACTSPSTLWSLRFGKESSALFLISKLLFPQYTIS